MPEWEDVLFRRARQLGHLLKSCERRLVLAESCTGGLIASALTDVPGISEFFCGSAVTYRNETKAQWLGVSRDDLAHPDIGAVSSQVAEQMCRGILQQTSEADLAAAITGHLGPNAPPGLDGVVYIGLMFRTGQSASVERHLLCKNTATSHSLRYVRQREAGALVLQSLLTALEQAGGQ